MHLSAFLGFKSPNHALLATRIDEDLPCAEPIHKTLAVSFERIATDDISVKPSASAILHRVEKVVPYAEYHTLQSCRFGIPIAAGNTLPDAIDINNEIALVHHFGHIGSLATER